MTTTSERILLPPHLASEIIAHARELTPRECCGIVSGRSGQPVEVHRLTNTEPGNTRYLFDDEEFFQVYWQIENRGDALLAVYHSHPATQAYPSVTDVEHAAWPEAVYLICSLENPDTPVIRGFRIVDGDISDVTVEIR